MSFCVSLEGHGGNFGIVYGIGWEGSGLFGGTYLDGGERISVGPFGGVGSEEAASAKGCETMAKQPDKIAEALEQHIRFPVRVRGPYENSLEMMSEPNVRQSLLKFRAISRYSI